MAVPLGLGRCQSCYITYSFLMSSTDLGRELIYKLASCRAFVPPNATTAGLEPVNSCRTWHHSSVVGACSGTHSCVTFPRRAVASTRRFNPSTLAVGTLSHLSPVLCCSSADRRSDCERHNGYSLPCRINFQTGSFCDTAIRGVHRISEATC
jgi:hypothetical protein